MLEIEKIFEFNKVFPTYNSNFIYHNTDYANINNIMKQGLVHTKGRNIKEYEGDLLWFTTNPQGFGGTTIAIEYTPDLEQYSVNTIDYTIPYSIKPDDIIFIDPMLFDSSSAIGNNTKLSGIKELVEKYGIDKVTRVLHKVEHHILKPFTIDDIDYILNYINNIINKL